jgi:hypothetical protein
MSVYTHIFIFKFKLNEKTKKKRVFGLLCFLKNIQLFDYHSIYL